VTTSEIPENDELLDRENVHFYHLPLQISARGAYSTQTHFYARNHRRFSKQALDIFRSLQNDVDFSLIHATEGAAYAFTKAKKKNKLNIPIIVSIHGAVTTGNFKSRLFVKRPYSRLLRKIVESSDLIVSNSFSLLEKIRRLPKDIKEKTEIIPHSLNCKKFTQIPKLEDIENFRDKYDLNLGKVTFLLQGPYITRKSQHEIIKYFPEIIEYHPDSIFLIIGEGPLLSKIKEEIVNLGIEDSVRITGYITDDELYLAYHTSDILLYPATEVSFSTPLIEALASGLPVVAVDSPPMNEMLPPDVDWLYPPDQTDQLIEKVVDIIEDKEASQQIAFESRKHALEKYDYNIVGKRIKKIYQKIIKESE
jgi:glycosyltransferase involved in cell wall biosynthesis